MSFRRSHAAAWRGLRLASCASSWAVGPDPATTPGTGPLPIVEENDLGNYTLPFVFADAPGDGVLKNLRWYRSRNTRSTGLPP